MGRNLWSGTLPHLQTLLHPAPRGSVSAGHIHMGQQHCGQPSGTIWSPSPAPCYLQVPQSLAALASLSSAPPSRDRSGCGSSPAQGSVYPLSGNPEQLGGEAVAEQRHLAQEGVQGGALKMRQRELRSWGEAHTSRPGEARKRRGTGKGRLRASQSPAALPRLASRTTPRPVTWQGLGWLEACGRRSAPNHQPGLSLPPSGHAYCHPRAAPSNSNPPSSTRPHLPREEGTRGARPQTSSPPGHPIKQSPT